jgi:TrmH family RNA methyltransferase
VDIGFCLGLNTHDVAILMSRETNNSVLILCEPEDPKNIGLVVRAMSCFGWSELRITGTQKFPLAEVLVTATRGSGIAEKIQYYPTFTEAIADCSLIIGFSRRKFDEQASFAMYDWDCSQSVGPQTALVFGRESTGINALEASLCNSLVHIPMHEGYSLNLGQAVAVVLNHWQSHTMNSELAPFNREHVESLANWSHKNAFIEQVKSSIKTAKPVSNATFLRLHRMLNRLNPTTKELDLLMGLWKRCHK